MPRLSDHFVKSAIRLVRQSTTVPNTSNTIALTAERSDMLAPCFFYFCHSGMVRRTRPGISRFRVRASRAPEMTALIEVEFFELAVLGLDVAHGASDRAHHHRLRLDDVVLAKLDARQQRTRGDAGCRKQ